jgi:hypothetical protein
MRHPAAPRDSAHFSHGLVRDPGTLSIIAIGATVVGTAMSAISAINQGQAASDAANYNAQLAQRNAQIATDQAGMDAEMQQRDARRRIDAAAAGFGASGLVTSEGSALDVLASSARDAELDRQTILYRGKLRALGYSDQSTLDQTQADNASAAGFGKAGAALLTGAGLAYRMFPTGTSPAGDGASDYYGRGLTNPEAVQANGGFAY